MTVIYQKWITRADLRANPDRVYLYGDNEARIGFGGQAREMRGEPNAYGIVTKRTPGTDESAYWSEKNYEEFVANTKLIDADLFPLIRRMQANPDLIVVIPQDGLGTGLADLSTRAPATLTYLGHALLSLKEITPGGNEPPVFFYTDLAHFYEVAHAETAATRPC